MDILDEAIVKQLLKDAKTTYRQLSKDLDISLGTVNKRIKRLEKEDVIQKYSIVADYEKLGYSVEVLIFLKISQAKFDELSKEILKSENVHIIFNMTGDWDAIILARFKEKQELSKFVKWLQKSPYVKESNTRLIFETLRR